MIFANLKLMSVHEAEVFSLKQSLNEIQPPISDPVSRETFESPTRETRRLVAFTWDATVCIKYEGRLRLSHKGRVNKP